MSKMCQGYMGSQIGKLGTAVGSRWKGRDVMRAYQKFVHDANTEAQQLVRARFAKVVALSKAFTYGLKRGLGSRAKQLKMTEYNVFMKCNWEQVTALTPDAVEVNYSGLVCSDGSLPEATFGVVDFGEAAHLHIEASLTGNVDVTGTDPSDEVYLFAYCPDLNQGCLGAPALRSADKVSVNVPASWDGMEVHVYGFAIGMKKGVDFGQTTRTAYCGSGEVA